MKSLRFILPLQAEFVTGPDFERRLILPTNFLHLARGKAGQEPFDTVHGVFRMPSAISQAHTFLLQAADEEFTRR